MKLKFIISILVLIAGSGCIIQKQKQLVDTWVMLNMEKKDGSRYVERNDMDKKITVFEFSKSYLYISYNETGSFGIPYTLIGDSLIRRENDSYEILKLNDTNLVLLVNASDDIPDDKINKMDFIRLKYYGDSIISKNHIKYVNDSTIELTRNFSPYYGRYWQTVINNKFGHYKLNGHVGLEVIMDSFGTIIKINLIENNNIPENIKDKIIKSIKRSNTWMLGYLQRNDYYKIDITVYFVSNEESQYAGIELFVTNPDDVQHYNTKQLTLTDINLSNKYFQEGINYFNNNFLDSAVNFFTKCISYDSLFLDAYYNRAAINQYQGRLNESCKDWFILSKVFGQKQAEKYYVEFCNDNN